MRPSRRTFLTLPVARLARAARYAAGERREAVGRGIRFIARVARDPKHFEENASDLLFCFYSLSQATSSPVLRDFCLETGAERAAYWRKQHPVLPEKLSANDVADYVYASLSVDAMGAPDPAMRNDLKRRAAQYTAVDFLAFDPLREPPPADIPHRCRYCRKYSVRGARLCWNCKRKLRMTSRYDIFFEALLTAYFGDRYGIRLGAALPQVTAWIPSLRPYRWHGRKLDGDFYSIAYTVTHIVYALNDYDQRPLPRSDFREEYEFLRRYFRRNIQEKDAETLGEFIDSLLVLGMPESDPLIREGMDFILGCQNPDGSWGDPKDTDIYNRYHTTWTGIGALMEYRWA